MPISSDSPAKSSATPPRKVVATATDNEMQIVSATSDTHFELPEGWSVEVRPRGPNCSTKYSDKYYYEPGSGRMFRSLLSVKRYLNGEEETRPRRKQSNCVVPYHNSGPFKRVVYGGKVYRPDELEEAHCRDSDDIIPTTLQPRGSNLIPDGWIVEEIPRKCGTRSDRYYIEPQTGQKFRSFLEVERYITEEKRRSRCMALAFSKHATGPRSSTRKKTTCVKRFKDTIMDLMNPPNKVSWVYSGDGKDNWSPLLEECVLPNYVKEQWSETFLLGMNGRWKRQVPQLTMSGNETPDA